MELWLRSGIRQIEMWNNLQVRGVVTPTNARVRLGADICGGSHTHTRTAPPQRLFGHWTHRLTVIIQWNATTQGLTQRVLRLLYGTTEGSDLVWLSMYASPRISKRGPPWHALNAVHFNHSPQ